MEIPEGPNVSMQPRHECLLTADKSAIFVTFVSMRIRNVDHVSVLFDVRRCESYSCVSKGNFDLSSSLVETVYYLHQVHHRTC